MIQRAAFDERPFSSGMRRGPLACTGGDIERAAYGYDQTRGLRWLRSQRAGGGG